MGKAKQPAKRTHWPGARASRPALLIGEEFRLRAAEAPDLALTAVHEAGHVVAARYFGRPVKAVTLDDGGAGGCMWGWPAASNAAFVRQTLVILAAGQAAARGYSRRGGVNADDDFQQMRSEARRLVGLLADQPAVDREIDHGRRRADRLIRLRWDDVVAVAADLLKFDTTLGEVPTGTLDDLDPTFSHI